jgi:hypothetical protein
MPVNTPTPTESTPKKRGRAGGQPDGPGTVKYVLEAEVRPRVRFCESLAVRAALGLEGIDPVEALLAIARTLGSAERHASTTDPVVK